VLGDSSTIVTEQDSLALRDLVTDLKPNIPAESDNPDSAQAAATDTTKKNDDIPIATAGQNIPAGNGLTVEFNEATIFIPNITTRSYRNQDPKKGSGVSYQLTGGNLNGGQLKIISGTITKVSQHYQTGVVIKNNLGTLPLDALTTTTSWMPMKGANGVYNITDLDPQKVEHPDASASEIRKATERALRTHRVNRRKYNEWLNSIRSVRSVNDAPMKIVIRNVVWKIEGRDTNGKPFQKQLRLDLP
jgi:hypothetical protein